MSNTPGSCVRAPEYVHDLSVSVTLGASSPPPPQPAARTTVPSKIATKQIRSDILARNLPHERGPVNTLRGGYLSALVSSSRAHSTAFFERKREADPGILDDCPDELAELRGMLLREHEWRRREGLA
jgi:hypothetical protein